MGTRSYWRGVKLPEFAPLGADIDVDVVVVGGGMTGVSAAYLLKQAGRRVALVERDRCAQLDTGNTTAHLTYITDRQLSRLVKSLGRDHAQAVWDAGLAAIQQIEAIVKQAKIDCDFARVPGYYHAAIGGQEDEREELQSEARVATELGFEAEYRECVPLFGRPGVLFPNQAVFHPLKYLAQLLPHILGAGSHVYELTEAKHFELDEVADRVRVRAGDGTISCGFVLIATDTPLSGLSSTAAAAMLQTKIAAYTSYAIAARVRADAVPRACFWDTTDPYYFLRVAPGENGFDFVVFGGLDHKTGHSEETTRRFLDLERVLGETIPEAEVQFHWSGQVIETHDGLPLIGVSTDKQFVATGYSGNGLTFGTLAAMMACDAVCGRSNPWSKLFDPGRTTLVGGAWNYLTENADYPYYMLKDRLGRSESVPLESIKPGSGRIVVLDRRRVAVFRDMAGRLTLRSPRCTHLGCIVHWNEAESTWDCPCHGSRFRPTGEVLAGPAEKPLEPLDPA